MSCDLAASPTRIGLRKPTIFYQDAEKDALANNGQNLGQGVDGRGKPGHDASY